MILLGSTTEILRVVTSATCAVDVYAAFVDHATSVGTPKAPQVTKITTATMTTIVAAPAASTVRNVKTLHLVNTHATTSVTVTVQFFNGTTAYELHKMLLVAGDYLTYVENVGFRAGPVGQYLEAEVLEAGAVPATTGVALNVTSLSLTAGDWDVQGLVYISAPGAAVHWLSGWSGTTSATLPTTNARLMTSVPGWAGEFTHDGAGVTVGTRRYTLASTTTVYLGGYAIFTGAALKLGGHLGARRMA